MIKTISTLNVVHSVQILGDGPSLLLLHGFTGSKSTWQPFVQKWSQRYRIIAVDIVGHGETVAPDDSSFYTMKHEAASLVAMIHLLDVEKPHLLGYSMGGRLALYLKTRYPHQFGNLVMESGSPGLEDPLAREHRRQNDCLLAKEILKKGINRFVEYWENIPLFSTQKQLPTSVRMAIRKERLSQNPRGLAGSLIGMGTGAQPSLWNELPSLTCCPYFIAGHRDHKFVAIGKRMAKETPGSKLNIITESGHAVHVEQPQIFDKIVYEDFYQSIIERKR